MKKFLIGVFIVIFILAGIFIYANVYFIPVQLKDFLSQKAQQYLSRPVSFRKISFHPLKGIVLQDLTIYQKDNPRQPVFKAEEIFGKILLLPLFQSRRVIIPSVTIVRPAAHIIRSETKEWNCQDLLDRGPAAAAPAPIPFYLGALDIRNGYVQMDILTSDGKTTDVLENLDLKIRLSLKKTVTFEGTAALRPEHKLTSPVIPGALQLQGSFTFPSKTWSAALQANDFPLSKYLDLFIDHPDLPRGGVYIHGARLRVTKSQDSWQAQGDCDLSADMLLTNGSHIKGRIQARDTHLKKDNRVIDCTAKIQTQTAAFELDPNRTFQIQALTLDAGVHYEDNRLTLAGDVALNDLNAQWPEQQTLRGDINLTNVDLRRQGDDFVLTAKAEMTASDLQLGSRLNFKGDAAADSFSLSARDGHITYAGPLQIQKGRLQLQSDKIIEGDIIVKESRITLADQAWSIEGDIESGPLTLSLDDKILKANPILMGRIAYDPQQSTPLTYSGTLILDQAELSGLPRVKTATGISGRIDFTTERFTTHALDAIVIDHAVRLWGWLENPRQPRASLQVVMKDADLQALYPYAPQQFKQSGIVPAGKADLEISYTGPLESWRAGEIKTVAQLKGIAVSGLTMPAGLPGQINDITGQLTLTQDNAAWENIKAAYAGDIYQTAGRLENFKQPFVEARLSSARFDTTVRMNILDRLITLSSLKGKYGQSSFDLKGEIENEPSGTYIDLQGGILWEMADLAALIPSQTELLGSLAPSGVCNIQGRVKGRTDDIKNLMLTASAESPSVMISKYLFKNVSLDIEHGYQSLSRLIAKAQFYGGNLSVTSEFDLKQAAYPFHVSAQLQDTDLVQLRKGLNLKGQDLSGMLSINLAGSGALKNLSAFEGYGDIAVADGLIWKLKILEGIWKLLFIPEFEGVAFTDTSATFSIREGKITTEDLLLKGLAADMAGKGWIDFDKNIQFTVSPTFKETEIIRSKSIQKGLSTLLARTEGYISVDITGTLAKPRYSVDTFPTKILKKATGALIEGVGDVLQDIFQ